MLNNQTRIGALRYPGFAKAAAKKRPEGKAKAKAAARATAKAEAKSAAEPFLKVMDVVKHGKRKVLKLFCFFSWISIRTYCIFFADDVLYMFCTLKVVQHANSSLCVAERYQVGG